MLGFGLPAVAEDSTASGQYNSQDEPGFATYESAIPGLAPIAAEATEVYYDEQGQVIPPGGEVAEDVDQATSGGLRCTPVSGRDYPHRSKTGVAVSGHGWYEAKGSCSNSTAKVYNCIYEWYTDNSWRRKDCSPTETVTLGGGAGNRSTARRNCDNTRITSWRNHVDVDVIGEWDTAEKPMRQNDVY